MANPGRQRTDEEVIRIVTAAMESTPRITRSKVLKTLGVSEGHILALEKAGRLVLPKPMSPKAAALVSTRKSPWKTNFHLEGTPKNGTPNKATRLT
jgi:hypothetical protein